MSYNLVNPTTGDLTRVAGRGKAEYGASSVRSGTYIPSSPVQAQEDLSFSVTFSEPMPDNDYQVIFGSSSNSAASGTIQCVVRSRSTTGFTGVIRNVGQNEVSVASGTFTWFAFKLYSDVEYSNIVNSMPSDASASNKLVTESDLPIKKIDISATGGATSFSATIPLSMAQRNKPFYLEVLSVGNNNAIKEMKYLVFVSSINTNVTTKEISKDSIFTNVSITFNASTGYELSFSSTDTLYSTTVYTQQ